MTDPNSAIPQHVRPAFWERYESWRAQKYQASQRKNAHRLARLRNRRGSRLLVGGVVASLLVLAVASVLAFVVDNWFFIPYVAGLVGAMVFLRLLGVVTGNVADAPVSALDEIQLAKRNSARSVGFIVLFALMFVPYVALILLGSFRESLSGHTVYGLGVVLITTMVVGVSVPSLLVAWWTEDPDPEDFVEPVPSDPPVVDSVSPPPVSASESAPTPIAKDPATPLDPPTPAPW